jgi:hypothetical protein
LTFGRASSRSEELMRTSLFSRSIGIFFINFPNKRCKISHNSAIITNFAQIFKRF